MTSLTLSAVTEEDLAGVCEVQYHAFSDPFSLALHPRTTYSHHVETFSNNLRRVMEQPSNYINKVVNNSDGRIISFAKWYVARLDDSVAGTEEAETKHEGGEKTEAEITTDVVPLDAIAGGAQDASKDTLPPPKKTVNMDFNNAFKNKIVAVQRRHVGDRTTLFLEILCTHPQYQGRGAAKMHLRWGEGFAGKMGMPVWLDASPAGLGLYQKEGFVFVQKVVTDLREWGGEGSCVHTCMVKEVGKGGEVGGHA